MEFFFLILGDADRQTCYPDKIKIDNFLHRSKKINKSSVISLCNLNCDLSMEKKRAKSLHPCLRVYSFLHRESLLTPHFSTLTSIRIRNIILYYSAILYCPFFCSASSHVLLEFYEAIILSK